MRMEISVLDCVCTFFCVLYSTTVEALVLHCRSSPICLTEAVPCGTTYKRCCLYPVASDDYTNYRVTKILQHCHMITSNIAVSHM